MSITNTCCPEAASVAARFVDTKVLPLWGIDEVVMITFILPSIDMKPILVRIMRKASDMALRLSSCTTMPSPLCPLCCGISPMKGIERASSMS